MGIYCHSGELSTTGKFFILLSMDEKEIMKRVKALDKRRGENLRRLRNRHGWSQEQLFEKTGIGQTKISAYENGLGFDKETLIRFCDAFKASEWEFDLEVSTPIVTDEVEQQDLFRRRMARAVGVAEDTAKYESFRIDEAKKKESAGSESASKRIPRSRIKKTA